MAKLLHTEIMLDAKTEVKRVKGKAGRPRVYALGMHKSFAYKGRRGAGVPTCLNRGCKKFLRVHQVGTCSDRCRNEVFRRVMQHLRWIEATKEEVVAYFDGRDYEATPMTAMHAHG